MALQPSQTLCMADIFVQWRLQSNLIADGGTLKMSVLMPT